jgi:hypothetical protein
MKNKHLVMLLLSSCCLAACVDSKYDLSDVNTDDAVMGESWVAPLGMGYVTSDDVVNVEKVPSISGTKPFIFVCKVPVEVTFQLVSPISACI